MPRYRLAIAYDGADFHGWQKQWAPPPGDAAVATPNPSSPAVEKGRDNRKALRTVQGVVERAIRRVVRQPIVLLGASRTDAGVHARAQTAAFSVGRSDSGAPASASKPPVWDRLSDDRLRQAFNSRLPDDVVIRDCRRTRDDFNPIGDCLSKGYRYQIHVGRDRPLWERRYIHQIRAPLDVASMADAAARFVGEHDFAAFARAGHGRLSTVRTVLSCSVSQIGAEFFSPWLWDGCQWEGCQWEGCQWDGRLARQSDKFPSPPASDDYRLAIDISGTGFLHNMVRIIAGTLVEVGRGRFDAAQVDKALASGDRTDAGPTLPAPGLCLMSMRYPDET